MRRYETDTLGRREVALDPIVVVLLWLCAVFMLHLNNTTMCILGGRFLHFFFLFFFFSLSLPVSLQFPADDYLNEVMMMGGKL